MPFENQNIIPTAEPFFYPGGRIGCLLLHGFTGTPKEMRLLGDDLHARGHTVLGIRLAGHATQAADMVRMRYHDWLNNVEDGLHLLSGICERIFVIGLSMGGLLTLCAASRFPFDGAVALSTPYRLPDDWRAKYINLFKYIMPSLQKGKDDWHDLQNGVGHACYPEYPTASIAELIKLVGVMHNSLPKIDKPVLLIQSKNDATVPQDHLQLIHDHIGSTDKEMLLIERSGHIIIEDTDREIVFESIGKFIQRIAGTRQLS